MSKQLGDKAIKFIIDLVTDGDSEIEIFEAKQELDQLIESHKENVKLKERVEELEKHSRELENAIQDMAFDIYRKSDNLKEFNEELDEMENVAELVSCYVDFAQFKQCESDEYAELGEAFEWAIKTSFDFVWNGDMDEDYPVDEEDLKALMKAYRKELQNV